MLKISYKSNWKQINSAIGESIRTVPARCLPVMFQAIMTGSRLSGMRGQIRMPKKKKIWELFSTGLHIYCAGLHSVLVRAKHVSLAHSAVWKYMDCGSKSHCVKQFHELAVVSVKMLNRDKMKSIEVCRWYQIPCGCGISQPHACDTNVIREER